MEQTDRKTRDIIKDWEIAITELKAASANYDCHKMDSTRTRLRKAEDVVIEKFQRLSTRQQRRRRYQMVELGIWACGGIRGSL